MYFSLNYRKKSVEDLLVGSSEAIGNSINQAITLASTSAKQLSTSPIPTRRSPSPGSTSPTRKLSSSQPSTSSTSGRREQSKSDTLLNVPYQPEKNDTAAKV